MINIPFNHQPDSTAVKTGSYTIPAGKYARVVVSEFNADFTIDGSLAIAKRVIVGTFSSVTTSTLMTNNTPYSGRIYIYSGVYSAGTNTFSHRNSSGNDVAISASVATGTYTELTIHSGSTVENFGGGSGFLGNGAFSFQADERSSEEFWVPSGTALVGDRYTVELYNEIT